MVSINPVREENATGEIKTIYEDVKQSLKLPWTPIIFQAFAAYPSFLQFIWHQLKPSVLTEQFHNDSNRSRGVAEAYMSQAHKPIYKHEDALANDLSIDDLVHIQTKLEALNYGNPKLLLISTTLYRAIGGISIGGNGEPEPSHDDFGDRVIRKIDINPVGEDEAADSVKAIYREIKSTLNVPFVNTDYMTLANWPGFLRLFWEDIKQLIDKPAHSAGKDALSGFAYQASDRLAYPVKMGRDEMESAGIHEENFNDIEDTVRFFARLVPGLLLNMVEARLVAEDLLEIERGEFAA